jgi:hypothetical protein
MDNIRMDIGEVGWGDVDWIGLAKVWTGGELLWIRYWTFGFQKMLGNYRVASRVVLNSIELVISHIIVTGALLCTPKVSLVFNFMCRCIDKQTGRLGDIEILDSIVGYSLLCLRTKMGLQIFVLKYVERKRYCTNASG